jgi:hypothetical protein
MTRPTPPPQTHSDSRNAKKTEDWEIPVKFDAIFFPQLNNKMCI